MGALKIRIHLLSAFFLIYIRICFLNANAFLHRLLLFSCKNDANVPKFWMLFRYNCVKRYRIINYLFLLCYCLQLMLPIWTTGRFSWFLWFPNLISNRVFTWSCLIIINTNIFIQMIVFRYSIWRMDSLRR